MKKHKNPFWKNINTNTSQELLKSLQEADWTQFQMEEDATILRSLLLEIEEKEGVSEVHAWVIEKLNSLQELYLMHNFGHEAKLTAATLSPDGKYLITGSDVPSDYDLGGVVQVWELASGRCVNSISYLDYGIGSERNSVAGTFKWSHDKKELGLVYSENLVTHLNPFERAKKVTKPPVKTCIGFLGGSGYADYAWSPNGKEMAFAYFVEENQLPIRIQYLHGQWAYDDLYQLYTEDERDSDDYIECTIDEVLPEKESPIQFTEEEFPFLSWIGWSKDNTRIFGHSFNRIYNSGTGRAYCIEALTGKPIYTIEVGRYVAWSPAEQYFAYTLPAGGGGMLQPTQRAAYTGFVIADATTGKTIFENSALENIIEFHWQEEQLAIITHQADNLKASVQIYQNNQFFCAFETSPLPDDDDFPDRNLWTWSPNGKEGVLRTERGLEHWEIKKNSILYNTYEYAKDVEAIFWGTEEVLACVGSKRIDFIHLPNKQVLHSQLMTGSREEIIPDKPSPLLTDNQNYNAEFPTFPLFPFPNPQQKEEYHWLAAFPFGTQGPVVCPEEFQSELDSQLQYVLQYSEDSAAIALPFRWKPCSIYPNMLAALETNALSNYFDSKAVRDLKEMLNNQLEELPFDLTVIVPQTEKKSPLETFLSYYDNAIDNLESDLSLHTRNEHYYLQSIYLSLLGKPKIALSRAEKIDDSYSKTAAMAQAILFAAYTQQKENAVFLINELEKQIAKQEFDEWNYTYTYAPLYGAYRLLEEEEKAAESLEKSKIGIENESNYFQKWRLLAEAYFYNADFEEVLNIYEEYGDKGGTFGFGTFSENVLNLIIDKAPLEVLNRFWLMLSPNATEHHQELAEKIEKRWAKEEHWKAFSPYLKRIPFSSYQLLRVLQFLAEIGQKDLAQKLLQETKERTEIFENTDKNILIETQAFFEPQQTRQELQTIVVEIFNDLTEYSKPPTWTAKNAWLDSLIEANSYLENKKDVLKLLPLLSRPMNSFKKIIENKYISLEFRQELWQSLKHLFDESKEGELLDLAYCALKIGDIKSLEKYSTALRENSLQQTGYERANALENLSKLYLNCGKIEEAYQIWLKQAKSVRLEKGEDLIKKLAQEGQLHALHAMFQKMTAADQNRAIMKAMKTYLETRVLLAKYVHEI